MRNHRLNEPWAITFAKVRLYITEKLFSWTQSNFSPQNKSLIYWNGILLQSVCLFNSVLKKHYSVFLLTQTVFSQ